MCSDILEGQSKGISNDSATSPGQSTINEAHQMAPFTMAGSQQIARDNLFSSLNHANDQRDTMIESNEHGHVMSFHDAYHDGDRRTSTNIRAIAAETFPTTIVSDHAVSDLENPSVAKDSFGVHPEVEPHDDPASVALRQDQSEFSDMSTGMPEDVEMTDQVFRDLLSQAVYESDGNAGTSLANEMSSVQADQMDIADGSVQPDIEHPIHTPQSGTLSADDTVLLNDQQRGRLAKYRVPDENWSSVKRSASVPRQCGDHYSHAANWPPQDPPRCDFGSRTDVFPPADAPLHLHVQAYALRWGVWAADIKDAKVRKQVLDTVANKMREAWENAIGENYYVRPVAKADDSDNRNDTEEKGKRGRKRAISPSKQPAGFVCEGKDALAVTNAELAQHNLTMETINKRVQERDFEAGERLLDEILENLGRDNLVVKDWSSSLAFGGSVRGRNLLMYSLFVVLDCRKERKKLNNLLANFTKEVQKRNTRARIENYQEREFQHMALACELQQAQQREQSVDIIEAEDDANMDTDVTDLRNNSRDDDDGNGDEDNEEVSNDESAGNMPLPAIQNDVNDKDLIREIVCSVLTANSESALYSIFVRYNLNAKSFDPETGLNTGGDQAFDMTKSLLGGILAEVTRLISLKEMLKRQQNPNEHLKMQHDARLSAEKLFHARDKLAKTLGLQIPSASNPASNQQPPNAEPQSIAHSTLQQFQPQQQLLSPRMETPGHGVTPAPNLIASPAPSYAAPSQLQSVQSTQIPANSVLSPDAQTHLPVKTDDKHVQEPPQSGYKDQQATRGVSQSPSQLFNPDNATKQAYINEKWRPWLDSEAMRRGQKPYQGVISDWAHIRDIVQRWGYGASDRNALLKAFKFQFEEWSKKKAGTIQSNIAAPSPVLSSVSSSTTGQDATAGSAPPNWPSDMEVRACIPPQGVHANNLLLMFQDRIGQFTSQFSQLILRVAFMDQDYTVYPSQQHAVVARQQVPTHTMNNPDSVGPTAGTPMTHRPSVNSHTETPSLANSKRAQHIVKLKFPQESSSHLPPAQNEANFPEGYRSTDVNETRGFAFRYLPHSTLEQRKAIDDMIADYIDTTARRRKKDYYGQYVFFKDPSEQNGLPVAHGFWEFKDNTKPEGSEWFFDGGDVPADWLPKAGLGGDVDNDRDNDDDDGVVNVEQQAQSSQYRDVYQPEHNRRVRIKLNTNQGQAKPQAYGYNQQTARRGSAYNTYPPPATPSQNNGQHMTSENAYNLPSGHQQKVTQYYPRNKDTCNYHADENQVFDTVPATTTAKKRGTKRSASTSTPASGYTSGNGKEKSRGLRAPKRRKRDVFGDDESDEDYVPGGYD